MPTRKIALNRRAVVREVYDLQSVSNPHGVYLVLDPDECLISGLTIQANDQ